MRKNINTQHIEGRLYQHDLTVKTVQNTKSANYGKKFINGNIYIAVDEEGLNVIPVHFTYVTELTSSKNINNTYVVLKDIIENGKTWIEQGKEKAALIKVDNNTLTLNDFYTLQNELISTPVNESGRVSYVETLKDESSRNTFEVDMLITKTIKKEEEEYLILRGVIFNYKNDILPMEFIVKNPAGISYFEDLNISSQNPTYTRIWGRINCKTVITVKEEQSAFGESKVTPTERKIREWEVTGTIKKPYDFGDEGVLTIEDITKANQNREVYLASVKARTEEYRANRNTSVSTDRPTIPNQAFDF